MELTVLNRKPGYRYDVLCFGDNITYIWTPLSSLKPWKANKRRFTR